MSDMAAQVVKHKHWRAFWSKNGWKGAPVLEFMLFSLNHAI